MAQKTMRRTVPAEICLSQEDEYRGLTIRAGRFCLILAKSTDKEYTDISLEIDGQEASSDDWYGIEPDFVFRPENLELPEEK